MEVVGYGLVVLVVGGALLDLFLWRRGKLITPAQVRREMEAEGFTPEDAETVANAGRPSGRPRVLFWIGFAIVASPAIVGSIVNDSIDRAFRQAPGILLPLGLGVLFAGTTVWMARGGVRRHFGESMFAGRHPILATGFMCLASIGVLAFAAIQMADWLVPYDRVEVQVTASSTNARGLTVSIETAQREYTTAAFWTPNVFAGPAILTVGHFSGIVVDIDQASVSPSAISPGRRPSS